ncbi:11008_t:CDS:2 [Dentiscutata erythropus]|uniref:11008_t:CDS:1 n=1 Tax=Dentiscutata erythropus TaxID=1348616 RepID=A0A9N9CZF2_9GLOM|nr:11008_t:CDS:2 [Dentiscutata erythropus]
MNFPRVSKNIYPCVSVHVNTFGIPVTPNDYNNKFSYLYQKYGDICEFRLGGYRRIVLSKPDYFENLLPLSKNLAIFTKHEYSPGVNMLGNFGRGMFLNNNYESWKINKYFLLQSISTPGFNEEVIKSTIESFEKLDGYWNSLKESQSCDDDWLQMDLLKWTSRFMTDIISTITTGERGCSMETYYNTFNDKSKLENSPFDDPKLYNSDKFTRALVAYTRGLASFYYIHPFFIRNVPYYKNKANILQKNKDYVIKTLDSMIERRKFDFANTPQKLKSKNDLLTLLINHDAKSKMVESLSDENIRALLCDTFMAGSDTG